jgi:hypothetical protein
MNRHLHLDIQCPEQTVALVPHAPPTPQLNIPTSIWVNPNLKFIQDCGAESVGIADSDLSCITNFVTSAKTSCW